MVTSMGRSLKLRGVGLKATVESTDNVDEVIKQLQHKAYEKVSKKFFG
jgi:hypothetical protein